MLYTCILCVTLLIDLFVLCVECLTICLRVVVIVLLNVMEVLSVGGGALLDIYTMYGLPKSVCVLCLWSQCASRFSYYMFFCVCVCRKLSSHFSV